MINLYSLSNNKSGCDKEKLYKSPYAHIYFRNRYEYYLDYLLSNAPNVFILPILQPVGATSFLNIRGSKIQMCGIIFEKTFIDEDYQTPGNFFGMILTTLEEYIKIIYGMQKLRIWI